MKRCTKCGTEREATPENFSGSTENKDGLSSWCRECQRKLGREYYQRNKGRINAANCERHQRDGVKRRAKQKLYRDSVIGRLHAIYNNLNYRCRHRKEYIEKGIKNKFESSEQFVHYVVEILKVDPRGLDCHRIDNDGHYEPGNIEFIDHDGHMKLHWETSRRVKY